MSGPAKMLAALGAPAPAASSRPRWCWRCETLAERAKQTGRAVPLVHVVESWVSRSVRYYAALCPECADWEWSANWNARREAAAANPPEEQALDRRKNDHLGRGRRFSPEARLTRSPR